MEYLPNMIEVATHLDKKQSYIFILNLKPTNNFKVDCSSKQQQQQKHYKTVRTKYI